MKKQQPLIHFHCAYTVCLSVTHFVFVIFRKKREVKPKIHKSNSKLLYVFRLVYLSAIKHG